MAPDTDSDACPTAGAALSDTQPTLLLTNDDGVEAEGLAVLAETAAPLGRCLIVAPRHNRSAIGHGITLGKSLRAESMADGPCGIERLAIHGTPADAVKFAHKYFAAPTLTLSGINNGPNVGCNVLYSGTVAAALESVLQGISAIAFSVANYEHPRYAPARPLIRALVPLALRREAERLASGERPFCWNVNIPDLPYEALQGVRWTRHGASGFDETIHRVAEDPVDHYRLDGEMILRDPDGDYDAVALHEGYVSITPLAIDWTDFKRRSSFAAEFDCLPPGEAPA